MIQAIVTETNNIIKKLHEEGELTKRILAIGVEINQRYNEYLDELLDAACTVSDGVTVVVDGKKIRFQSMDDFSNWITENMT